MRLQTLLWLALLQPLPGSEPLRSGCAPDDQQIGEVAADDRVEVQMALAGEEKTCYKIVVDRHGQKLSGYVFGEALPAILDFVRQRQAISEESVERELRLALAQSVKPVPNDAGVRNTDPLLSRQFEDFSGRGLDGKAVSLSGLNGRVTLVTFWSPSNPKSVGELVSAMPLYNQFHSMGLAAVGVIMDSNPTRIRSALDDVTLGWPQIPDRNGLAARYQVDPKAGKTFVLDSSHRIVAVGTLGPEIESTIRRLLTTPEERAQ